jgi:hypothetical protein
MDTFAKFLIVNEVVGNADLSFPKSAYMYKDSGGKISLGPLWDFDGAFCYEGGGENVYFTRSNYRISMHPFFKRLFADPVFAAKYKDTWNANYPAIQNMQSFITDMAHTLNASQKANFTVWRWLNKLNYQTEISKMKAWWNARAAYLNADINT